MGYASGPYRNRDFLPVPPRPVGVSSREITKDRQFVVDPTTGGFVGMSDAMQRVVLLIDDRVPPLRGFSSDEEREKYRQLIFVALRPVTDSRPPAIQNLVVEITSTSPGKTVAKVDFVNRLTNDKESRQL